jgi:predicted O-methyltransferase YrrM
LKTVVLRAIETSAGVDTGGMALAANRGCQVLLMDQDEERLVKAAKVAKKRGLGDVLRTKKVDISHIDDAFDDDEQFEAAVVKASLTHYPNALKVKILQDLRKHSNQILLHEIGLRNVIEGSEKALHVQRDVGQALAIGFHPLTVDGWRKILDECGYEITNIEG